MSTLTNTHTFLPFDSKTSKPYAGQRLVKVLYKTPKNSTEEKRQSVCVSIPQMNESLSDVQLVRLMPHIQNMLETVQDGICKDAHENKALAVTDAMLSVDAIIEYLDTEILGDRLTKEKVEAWFVDSGLRDSLAVAFANKLGISDAPTQAEEKKLNQALAVYADKFASMAGGKTSFAPDVAIKLQAALSVIDPVDAGTIGTRFATRLDKMIAAKDDMMLAL